MWRSLNHPQERVRQAGSLRLSSWLLSITLDPQDLVDRPGRMLLGFQKRTCSEQQGTPGVTSFSSWTTESPNSLPAQQRSTVRASEKVPDKCCCGCGSVINYSIKAAAACISEASDLSYYEHRHGGRAETTAVDRASWLEIVVPLSASMISFLVLTYDVSYFVTFLKYRPFWGNIVRLRETMVSSNIILTS